MREQIEKFVAEWERKAKNAMFLDGPLHPRIRQPLIDGLAAIVEADRAAKAGARAVTNIDDLPADAPAKPKKGKSR